MTAPATAAEPVAYMPVAEARAMPGLRLALTAGLPGPWSVACRAIFDLKGIAYVPVAQVPGGDNAELVEWTGQKFAPAAMLDDQRPRTSWVEQLLLAERLAPSPRLIPADEAERVEMFGLGLALCGEDGFGWSARRLLIARFVDNMDQAALDRANAAFSSGETLAHARARLDTILAHLASVAERQAARGSGYLVGAMLSAADIYWFAFSNLLWPVAPAFCPSPAAHRAMCETFSRDAGLEIPPVLLAHRDRILRDHIATPLRF